MILLEIFPLGLFLIAFFLYQLLKHKVPSYMKPIRVKIYFVFTLSHICKPAVNYNKTLCYGPYGNDDRIRKNLSEFSHMYNGWHT
jgi:hypothetical protein